MSVDKEFFAWLDGELDSEEAAAMAARVAADPELARLAARHRTMNARLGRAFDPIVAERVPERLFDLMTPHGAGVVDLVERRERRRLQGRIAGLPQWATIAATLVLGIFAGTLVPGREDSPVEVSNGGLYATGSLDRALGAQLASAPSAGAVQVELTFRDSSGRICRSFTGPEVAGLACRDGSRWRLRGLFPPSEGQSADYRMAAGMSPELASLVDSTMAGEPMDAAEEAATKRRGWR